MAKISLLAIPLSLIHSTDKERMIAFLIKTVKNPDDRPPVYIEWAYVNSVAIEAEDMEILVQLSEKDLSSPSES